MCSLQNVFSIECVLYGMCVLSPRHSSQGAHILQNMFSIECVLYRADREVDVGGRGHSREPADEDAVVAEHQRIGLERDL